MTHRVESKFRFDSMSFYIYIDYLNKMRYNNIEKRHKRKGDKL